MKRLVALSCLMLLVLATTATAQQGAVMPPRFDPSKPLHIEAERLEADHGDEVIRFEGKVVVTQDDAVLTCDVLLLYYRAERAAKPTGETTLGELPATSGEIKRLIALGRVTLTQGAREASCERAEYDHREGTITLTGSPKIAQGSDFLQGDKILIHVREQRVKILGGKSGRVSVTINPGKAAGPSTNDHKE